MALLVNPANVANTEANLKGVEAAARTMGLQIQVVRAGTISEIDKSFETIAGERVDALFVSTQGDFSGAATLYIGGIVLRGPMLGRNGTNEHHAPSPTPRGHPPNKVLFRRKINLFNHGFSTCSLGLDRILRWWGNPNTTCQS